MVNKLYIVLAVIVGVIVIVSVVLYILYKRNWPVTFSLQSIGRDSIVDIYANDMVAFHSQPLKTGVVTNFTISDNIHNLRTNAPLTRNQLKSVTVYLSQPATIVFSPGNMPSNHTVILSNDQSGFSVISSNVIGNWTQPGYYTISFPNGIPLF